MVKTNLTKDIEYALFNHFFLKKSLRCGLEVRTLDERRHWNRRVDFLAYRENPYPQGGYGEFICIEIKISKSDFKSKNGHNFVGHYNYYAMSQELFEEIKNEISEHVGVYVLKDCGSEIKNVKKAKRIDKPPVEGNEKFQAYNVITACNSTIRRLLVEDYLRRSK